MPSIAKKAYDLVSDDGYDSRIPLHNEQAFEHGIAFQAKYVGTLEIPRPSSRVEIVAAMRRIRYEFKANAIKKKKVSLLISLDGLKVILRNNRRKKQWNWDESRVLVMQHPIDRIFYVSHDSQDLKIWSCIAREAPSNVFRCNVFKAYKKSQATSIVRTLGQAFEVCSKLSLPPTPSSAGRASHSSGHHQPDEERDMTEERNMAASDTVEKQSSPASSDHPLPQTMEGRKPSSPVVAVMEGEADDRDSCPQSTHHQLQLLRHQLHYHQHQTRAAIAQVHLLKDHLSAETAARIEAQARTQQLLLHNRDLLEHVRQLVDRLQALHVSADPDSSATVSLSAQPLPVPECPYLSTPSFSQVSLPPDWSLKGSALTVATFQNSRAAHMDTQSPDSGHREMSSDSLAFAMAQLALGQSLVDSVQVQPCKDTPSAVTCIKNTSTVSASTNPLFSGKGGVESDRKDDDGSGGGSAGGQIKIITPLPLQDASGNRLDLSKQLSDAVSPQWLLCTPLPRIEPPPRVQKASRKVHRTARGSWYGGKSGVTSPMCDGPKAQVHMPKSVSDPNHFYTTATDSTSPRAGDSGTYQGNSDTQRLNFKGHSDTKGMNFEDHSNPQRMTSQAHSNTKVTDYTPRTNDSDNTGVSSLCLSSGNGSSASLPDPAHKPVCDITHTTGVPRDCDCGPDSSVENSRDRHPNGLQYNGVIHKTQVYPVSEFHTFSGRYHHNDLDQSNQSQNSDSQCSNAVHSGV